MYQIHVFIRFMNSPDFGKQSLFLNIILWTCDQSTSLWISFFNELSPIITTLVNLSLSERIFSLSFKKILVQPLLKKTSLSTDNLINIYPFSNLNFISKILEKVVAFHTQSHLSSNSLSCLLHFNLLTGSFILLKLLISKFTMTSSLRWIMVKSLSSFFSTYLLLLILLLQSSLDHLLLWSSLWQFPISIPKCSVLSISNSKLVRKMYASLSNQKSPYYLKSLTVLTSELLLIISFPFLIIMKEWGWLGVGL